MKNIWLLRIIVEEEGEVYLPNQKVETEKWCTRFSAYYFGQWGVQDHF